MKDNDTAHKFTSANPSLLFINCKLTHREIEILQLARHGLSAKEMALQLKRVAFNVIRDSQII
jgi:DNA-binding NarL/FixJ family response regulator